MMTKDNFKLASLFTFFLLTMFLILKLHNVEMKYVKKEAQYKELVNKNLETTLETNKVKKEYLIYKETLEEKVTEQEGIIRSQQEMLEELNEFKDILETVKKFSGRNLKEEEAVIAALSIYKASEETKLSWRVISAMIMTESNYRANIVSPDPSYGLMQLKLPTANYIAQKIGKSPLDEEELLDISKNVELGSKYLLSQVIRFSSLSEGIMAYNFGGGRLRQLKKEKRTKFESVYLKKIKSYHEKIDEFLKEQRVSMN